MWTETHLFADLVAEHAELEALELDDKDVGRPVDGHTLGRPHKARLSSWQMSQKSQKADPGVDCIVIQPPEQLSLMKASFTWLTRTCILSLYQY